MASVVFNHKQVLEHLGGLIHQEKECASVIYPGPQSDSLKNIISTLDIALEKTGEEFKVLIIGNFNGGKSSMINALIGEDLLPTGFLPETAVIGELHYGDKKRITLYPKKGQWEGGDEPFDLKRTTPDEIAKYVSLTADDAVNSIYQDEYQNEIGQGTSETRIVSKFDKMVIYWPLEILKDGVVIVDSPGINDPYHNDTIVNGYLCQADAIVFIMSCTAPYSGVDKEKLDEINITGYRNILTGYTMYDIVLPSYRNKPKQLEAFRQRLISNMMQHTDLGVQSVHFLSNIEALRAKEEGDEEALVRSGFKGFEDFMARYLVEGKGKDQVRNMAATIVLNARKMMRDAVSLDTASSTEIGDLLARVRDNEKKLDDLRIRSLNYADIFRRDLESHLPEIRRFVEEFVYTLADSADLEGFKPSTQLPTGPRKLWPWGDNGVRHLAQELQKECQREFEHRMDVALRGWCNDSLDGKLKSIIAESVNNIKPGLERIARDLEEIRADLSGGAVSDVNGDVGNIAVGLAYALLTGDWLTGGMSAVYGKGTMGRVVLFQLGIGATMGLLIAMGIPITLPIFLATVWVGNITAILTKDNEGQIEHIKTQTVSDIRASFKSDDAKDTREAIVNAIMKNVSGLFGGACEDMKNALKTEIASQEEMIDRIIQTCSQDAATKKLQVEARAKSVSQLKAIEAEVLDVCGQYGIAKDFVAARA